MKIAVVGASGVVGRALVNHLMKEGIDVVGLSRRAPDGLTAPFVALDLMNAEACVATVQTHLTDVTHVVYAALYEKPGFTSPNQPAISGHRDDHCTTSPLVMLKVWLAHCSWSNAKVLALANKSASIASVTPLGPPG